MSFKARENYAYPSNPPTWVVWPWVHCLTSLNLFPHLCILKYYFKNCHIRGTQQMAIVIFIMEFKKFSQEDYLVNKTYYCARKYPTS